MDEVKPQPMKLSYLVEAGEYDPATGEVRVSDLEQAKLLLKQMVKDILNLRAQLQAKTEVKSELPPQENA